jgi:predicted GTPase
MRRAHVVVINKVDTARPADIETVRSNVQQHNPSARIIDMACRVSVKSPEVLHADSWRNALWRGCRGSACRRS